MTNERAIERLKERITDNQEKTLQIFLEQDIEAIETVLNLLEKKDKKIEDWKMEYNHWCQLAIDRKRELEKKDKIIDEMVDFIDEIDGCLCFDLETRNCIDKNCKECIKQYFEYKVEEDK